MCNTGGDLLIASTLGVKPEKIWPSRLLCSSN
ncbi:helix-turn-helix domain-containing protein [Dickeya fangzhongdai]